MRIITLTIGLFILLLVAATAAGLIMTVHHWTVERLCIWPVLMLAGAGGVGFVMTGKQRV